jgi:hypothetical protein
VSSTRAPQLAGLPAAAATHLHSVPLAYVRAGDPPDSSFDRILPPRQPLQSALQQRYSDVLRTSPTINLGGSNNNHRHLRLLTMGWAGPPCQTTTDLDTTLTANRSCFRHQVNPRLMWTWTNLTATELSTCTLRRSVLYRGAKKEPLAGSWGWFGSRP